MSNIERTRATETLKTQGQLALMALATVERVNLPWEWIALCDTAQAAARLCIRHGRPLRTQEDIAEILGLQRSHFCTMLSADNHKRTRNMPLDLIEDLQDLCGNNAINQWQQLYRTKGLKCQQSKASREAELLRELEQLRAG